MRYDAEHAELIISRPFAVYGTPIPDYLQDEIGRRMAAEVPKPFRPVDLTTSSAGALAVKTQGERERAEAAPEVRRLFEVEKLPVRTVAREMGRSDAFVRRVAREHGIAIPEWNTQRRVEASRRAAEQRKALRS